ncbi:MAG: nucleotidyltransferase domain-containing protein [Nanoarchaeota archaeon]|nr:nucleotidyltransferase domain-containing protein [Nanoarchaeota archaeon]
MKQKSIKEEIFIRLDKSEMHQRELERILGINQTNIRRALLKMESENLVDKKEVGKSKIYFVKDSLEARIYTQIVENYKLIKAIEKPKIRKVLEEIYKKILLNKINSDSVIVLFGSYAKNRETKNSDIDIYLNSNSRKEKDEIEEIDGKINVVAGSFDKNNLLYAEIKKDHVILNNLNGFYNLIK